MEIFILQSGRDEVLISVENKIFISQYKALGLVQSKFRLKSWFETFRLAISPLVILRSNIKNEVTQEYYHERFSDQDI